MKYKIVIARIEHYVYEYEVEGESITECEDKAWELFNESSVDEGDLVHAEEFINECSEIEEVEQ
jgi:hypothetical protein